MPAPLFQNELVTLYQGNALDILRELPPVDAVITDPPYSSGGMFRADKCKPTSEKYQTDRPGQKTYTDFAGDNRDQRSWTSWCSHWMQTAHLRTGGYFLAFTDWRQLPAMTDAMQWAGYNWRGLISWDKGPAARAPHKGYFRHQCEYIVWGTRGYCPMATHAGPYPGAFTVPVNHREKRHLTGKPLELMRQLVRIVPPGGLIDRALPDSGPEMGADIAVDRHRRNHGDALAFARHQRVQAEVDHARHVRIDNRALRQVDLPAHDGHAGNARLLHHGVAFERIRVDEHQTRHAMRPDVGKQLS